VPSRSKVAGNNGAVEDGELRRDVPSPSDSPEAPAFWSVFDVAFIICNKLIPESSVIPDRNDLRMQFRKECTQVPRGEGRRMIQRYGLINND